MSAYVDLLPSAAKRLAFLRFSWYRCAESGHCRLGGSLAGAKTRGRDSRTQECALHLGSWARWGWMPWWVGGWQIAQIKVVMLQASWPQQQKNTRQPRSETHHHMSGGQYHVLIERAALYGICTDWWVSVQLGDRERTQCIPEAPLESTLNETRALSLSLALWHEVQHCDLLPWCEDPKWTWSSGLALIPLCSNSLMGRGSFSAHTSELQRRPNLHSPIRVCRNDTHKTHPMLHTHWDDRLVDLLKPGCPNLGKELAADNV